MPALAAAVVVLMMAGAAGVVGIVGLPGIGSGGSAYAATPKPLLLPSGPGRPAEPALERLAGVAAEQPMPDLKGRYRYTKIRAWYLNSAVSSEGTTSELEPSRLERWRARDGSGRSIEIDEDGRNEQTYSAGEGAPLPDADRLSTDPETLSKQLLGYPYLGHDNQEIPNDIEFVYRLHDLLAGQGVVRPELQAALWEALSTKGLTNHGLVTDRGGRDGLALTLDSDAAGLPTRHVLIVDPDTAQLLSYEEVLIKEAGKLNVRIPAVLEYEVYLNAGTVDSTHQRPARDIPTVSCSQCAHG